MNLQLQTAGLEMTGKLDCQLVIERLDELGTVSLHTILRSLMAPKGAGGYIYIYIYICIWIYNHIWLYMVIHCLKCIFVVSELVF